jgi:hypothetical protein
LAAVVVERGVEFYLIGAGPGRPRTFSLGVERALAVDQDPTLDRLPGSLIEELRALSVTTPISAASGPLAQSLTERLDRPVSVAATAELRAARTSLPAPEPGAERRLVLALARNALERSLRTPEEVLITLTREEERVERAVGRESRAAESFLAVPGSSLADYSRRWATVRLSLEDHHAMLDELVRVHARSVVPNLAAVVGERAAARLVAEAGGLAALARMRAGRIQLLGTRRRPSPDRGPRYGILYRAQGVSEVPPGRRGAYARSLGALAAIAVRADATTHASISRRLVARRDRRIAQLRGSLG